MPKSGKAPGLTVEDSGTLEEINAKYPGEWLLLEITESGDRDSIERVRVLARGRQRKDMTDPLIRAHGENPRALLTVFLGGTILNPTREDLRKAIEQASKEDKHVTPRWEEKYATPRWLEKYVNARG